MSARQFVNHYSKYVAGILFIKFYVDGFLLFSMLSHFTLIRNNTYIFSAIGFIGIAAIIFYNHLLYKWVREKLWHYEFKKYSQDYIKKWSNSEYVEWLHDNYPYDFYSYLEFRSEIKEYVMSQYPDYFKTQPDCY